METKVLFNEYVAEHYDVLKKIATKEVKTKKLNNKDTALFIRPLLS